MQNQHHTYPLPITKQGQQSWKTQGYYCFSMQSHSLNVSGSRRPTLLFILHFSIQSLIIRGFDNSDLNSFTFLAHSLVGSLFPEVNIDSWKFSGKKKNLEVSRWIRIRHVNDWMASWPFFEADHQEVSYPLPPCVGCSKKPGNPSIEFSMCT